MGELSCVSTPRDLAGHYRETRKRLWAPSFVPTPAPQPARVSDDNMRELARLRLETKIFRDFLTERGIDVQAVINRKPSLSTVEIDNITIRQIVTAVCDWFLITRIEVMAARRTKNVVAPRHVAFYLACELTSKSLSEIGKHIGKRDHTTVLHGIRRIRQRILIDEDLCHSVALIRRKLAGDN